MPIFINDPIFCGLPALPYLFRWGRVDGGDFEECVDRGDALFVALALIVAVQNE